MLINVDFYIMALRDGFPVPDPAKLINSQGKHLPVQNRVLSRLKKEGADMFVYVIDKAERPLMPTSRCGHVRILLKQKKAKVVNRNPFTIQLLYDTPSITQNLTLGIDPGRTNIGLCIVTDDNKPVFSAEIITRNKDVPKLMSARKYYRQKHRQNKRRKKRQRRAKTNNTVLKSGSIQRHLPSYSDDKSIECKLIRNKEARFSNRKRPDGWLTPTANQLLQTHINALFARDRNNVRLKHAPPPFYSISGVMSVNKPIGKHDPKNPKVITDAFLDSKRVKYEDLWCNRLDQRDIAELLNHPWPAQKELEATRKTLKPVQNTTHTVKSADYSIQQAAPAKTKKLPPVGPKMAQAETAPVAPKTPSKTLKQGFSDAEKAFEAQVGKSQPKQAKPKSWESDRSLGRLADLAENLGMAEDDGPDFGP